MIDGCSSCGFMGLEGSGSEFERLNNAIVRAAMKGKAWNELNDDWQDEVVEERNWKIALPGVWSGLMEEYWTRYAQLYAAATVKERAALVDPNTVVPGGISAAVRELYAPVLKPVVEATAEAKKAVVEALEKVKQDAKAKVKAALREAGKEAAKGAAEQFKNEGTDWTVWVGGLALLGAVGYLAWRGKR